MATTHEIHVRELRNGTFVCHGELWHSLDKLKAHKDKFYGTYALDVQKADESTDAYWMFSRANGTAHFMDQS